MPDVQLKFPTINGWYKPSEKEQEIRKWVYERYHAMKDAPERKSKEKEWELAEKAWDAYREPKSIDDWQSNYYIPLTTSVVESIVAEFVDEQQRPLILPRSQEDTPKAMVMGKIFDYTWEVGDGDEQLEDVFKDGVIKGTAIAQEYYFKDRRLVHDILDFEEKTKGGIKYSTKEREIFEFDDVYMEWCSLWDIFVDEKAREFNRGTHKARDCVRRYVMNYRDAKRFFDGPIWNPLNTFQYVKPGGDTNFYQFYKPQEDVNHTEDVEILWYWARSPEDKLVIVINDVVIVDGPNPHKHKQLPFAKAIDVKRVGYFYGKGEPKLLESIQEELNTMRRMMIDRAHLDIDKSFLVGQTTMLDDTDLIARPHNVIPVDDPKNVRPLEYGDVSPSATLTQRSITEDSVRVTGVDDRFQSIQKAPSTATEAAILKESTLKRIKMKIRHLQRGFLTEIARLRVQNILQFYSQPKLERIVGEAGTKDFKDQVATLAQQGIIEVHEGVPYKQSYRNIRLDGTKLVSNERGQMTQQSVDGFSFFEARPDYFTPISGGFDIKFEAGATLAISKPLQQSKALEMYDRLLPLAQLGAYDLVKLGDFLVKVNDYNPSDFKKMDVAQTQNITDNRVQMLMQLAQQENQNLVQGKTIPPHGTPYASPAHTQIHIAFLRSPQMKGAQQQMYDMLVAHVTGEMVAIEARSGGMQPPEGMQMEQMPQQSMQPMPGQPQPQPPQGGQPTNAMAQIMPNRIQGGNQVQNGLPLGPGR